jgi:2'-5' RNA ligase
MNLKLATLDYNRKKADEQTQLFDDTKYYQEPEPLPLPRFTEDQGSECSDNSMGDPLNGLWIDPKGDVTDVYGDGGHWIALRCMVGCDPENFYPMFSAQDIQDIIDNSEFRPTSRNYEDNMIANGWIRISIDNEIAIETKEISEKILDRIQDAIWDNVWGLDDEDYGRKNGTVAWQWGDGYGSWKTKDFLAAGSMTDIKRTMTASVYKRADYGAEAPGRGCWLLPSGEKLYVDDGEYADHRALLQEWMEEFPQKAKMEFDLTDEEIQTMTSGYWTSTSSDRGAIWDKMDQVGLIKMNYGYGSVGVSSWELDTSALHRIQECLMETGSQDLGDVLWQSESQGMANAESISVDYQSFLLADSVGDLRYHRSGGEEQQVCPICKGSCDEDCVEFSADDGRTLSIHEDCISEAENEGWVNARDYKITDEGKEQWEWELKSTSSKESELEILKEIAEGKRDWKIADAETAKQTGVMIAFFLPKEAAQKLSQTVTDGEPPEDMHITLAYLGDTDSIPNIDSLNSVIENFAKEKKPISGNVGGIGIFNANKNTDGEDVIYASFDSPEIVSFREDLLNTLRSQNFEPSVDHGFIPHITLKYIEKGDRTDLPVFESIDVSFDALWTSIGPDNTEFKIGG